MYLTYFVIGIIICFAFGAVFSHPSLWKSLFNGNTGSYLKAGEYGESELNNSHWSLWKEPLNAWTSLAYTIFGCVVLLTGISDLYGNPTPVNNYSINPGFSILHGGSCFYLGMASFLFHASHSETWRKADAGMTSGVMAASLVFGIWDRARPPGADAISMIVCAVVFQFSLTHGYLPYGSSDALLPTLIAASWGLELLPRYGGVVDNSEYKLWMQCFFGAVGGMLLRASDIKRNSPQVFSNLIKGYFALLIFPFGYIIGYFDPIILLGVCGGLLVYKYPEKGHICWHIYSAFALFIWWYLLRTRSGDPVPVNNMETALIAIAFFAAVKNAVRRIFMALPFSTNDMRTRIMVLAEHAFFTVWGWYVLVIAPGEANSWLLHPILCFQGQTYPQDLFHLFYQVKVATHVEDLLYMGVVYYLEKSGSANSSGTSEAIKKAGGGGGCDHGPPEIATNDDADDKTAASKQEVTKKIPRDVKMDIHHIVTAVLCLSSYVTGYAKIGSLVMILHDASDVPLDLLRICSLVNASTFVQSTVFILTVLSWIYWRLWFFPTSVLYTIAFHSKSVISESSCKVGECTWEETPERIPFLLFLGTLQVLHVLWFFLLLKKGYRALFCAPSNVSEV